MLVGIAALHAFIAYGGHLFPQRVIPREPKDFLSHRLIIERRNDGTGRAERIVAVAVDELTAAPDIRCHIRAVCRESLEHGERLSLTDAGKHKDIHAWQIVCHFDGACEIDTLQSELGSHALNHVRILRVLLEVSHDVELRIRHGLLHMQERTQERHNILDGYDADNRTDADRSAVIFELRDILEPLHMDAIRYDADLARIAAEFRLDLRVVLEQRVDVIGLAVGQPRERVKIRNPHGFEIALGPFALDDLRLAFARVDPVLRDDVGLMIQRRRNAADDAAVPRRHAVVDIRLGNLLLQQIKEWQQHGAHRPEEIREWQIAELFAVDGADDIKEIPRHEDVERALPFAAVENLDEAGKIDIALPAHECQKRLPLLCAEHALLQAARLLRQDFVEEHFLDAREILWELVLECAAVFGERADGVHGKLDVLQSLDEHLRPGRHAAYHIGVRTLRQQTYFHDASSLQ